MSYQDPTTDVEQKPEETKKKRGGLLLIIVSVLLIAGGVTFGVWSLWPSNQGNQLVDMDGRVVVPDDPSATSPEFMEAADMVEDDGGDGFVVPALNLDVPLGSVNEVNGVMNPANFTNVFTIRNRGVGSLEGADQGTLYMVTHAIYGGNAPGNILQNGGQAALAPGDIIKADQRQYKFESAEVINKKEIDKHAELWTDDPGRLVLITCVVRPEGGIADDNLVIIASLVA